MSDKPTKDLSSPPQLALGLLFGVVFGFLLQKGGVGKYHILIGQLLLQDWTVLKVMGTGVLVGSIGVWTLHGLGKVELHLKPTKLAANAIGGLVFGAGFALSAYCPGTNLTALGQGNFDALAVLIGLLTGSWLFANVSDFTAQTVETWGNLGKQALPDLLHVRRGVFIPVFLVVLALLLFLVDQSYPR